MKSKLPNWSDDTVPYICWDRNWTVADIKRRLVTSDETERHRVAAWLMRELKTSEVWFFLNPREVYQEFEGIKKWLGPARPLWEFLFRSWHELGKV